MFILRAETRAEAEAIAFQEPNTRRYAHHEGDSLGPGEGDINISISFTNGTVKIDRAQLSIGQWLIWTWGERQ